MPECTSPTTCPGVIYVITSLAMGGAQHVLLQLLAGRPAHTEPVCVIVLRREPGIEDKVTALGIDVFHLELNKPWQLPVKLVQLWRYLRKRTVRILFSVMPHANLFAALLKMTVGRRWRLIWNLHNTPDHGLYPRRDHRFILWLSHRLAQRLPEKIIVVSERSRTRYLELGYPPEKLLLIHNGVNIAAQHDAQKLQVCRANIRQELAVEPDAILLGSLTRYVPAKNIPMLLQAFQLFRQHYQHQNNAPVYLLLAGENIEVSNAELQQLLVWYQLEDSVLLLGIRSDAPDLIRALDIATLSSVSESLPLFLVEAMAAGIPCVATDVGDIAVLFGGTGWLVASEQPEALAEAWFEVLRIPQRERIQQAHQRVERKYSMSGMLDSYAQVFKES